MKRLLFIYIIFLLLSGCRKESPIEDQDPKPAEPIVSAFSIISPLDSDEYSYGQEVLIKWLPVHTSINIELYRKTEYKFEIASDVNRNGEYIWIVPDGIPASVHYRIKIIPKGNSDLSVYSEEFTIKGY